jgi:flagellar protein FliS
MKNGDYEEIEVISEVLEASPHKLILLLLEKCLNSIDKAILAIHQNDIPTKIAAIDKILDILSYLRLCLNFEDPKTKEISTALDSVYTYVQNIVVRANASNNDKDLSEAYQLILNIKEGWSGMKHE